MIHCFSNISLSLLIYMTFSCLLWWCFIRFVWHQSTGSHAAIAMASWGSDVAGDVFVSISLQALHPAMPSDSSPAVAQFIRKAIFLDPEQDLSSREQAGAG